MKTVGIRALRENPGILSEYAKAGEYALITNRNKPLMLTIPLTDELLEQGLHANIAIKLFQQKVLTLSVAAKLAKLSPEAFLEKLALLGIVVVDQDKNEFEQDLKTLD